MFNDARRSLKYGGELYVVGNRHLDYFRKLKRAFGNCTTIATNNKFVVLKRQGAQTALSVIGFPGFPGYRPGFFPKSTAPAAP